MKTMVEICCGSYQDCLTAYRAGIKRVELNSALYLGGLTPGVAALRKVKEETDLEVICMVRPRGAGFCYDEAETDEMLKSAQLLLENGADGIAFGFLKADRSVDPEKTGEMVRLIRAYEGTAVFHRAFDISADPEKAMNALLECHVDRVLTGGQKEHAVEGAEMIRSLQCRYGEKIEILAGGGINYRNARELLVKTGVAQLHASCRGYAVDPTTIAAGISYGYLSGENASCYEAADPHLIEELLQAVGEGYGTY